MMNKQSSSVEMDQVQARRFQMARMIMWVSVVAALVFLVVLTNLLIGAPQFANRYLLLAIGLVFLVFSAISLWLIQRRQLNRAIMLYLPGLIVGLTAVAYFLGGVTGPVTPGLIVAGAIVGLIGGSRPLRYVSITICAIYLTLAILEATQVLHPPRVPDAISWILEILIFLNSLTVTALVAGVFINQTERAFEAERQRGLELVNASHRAEESAMTERELRERESHSAAHLRETVAGYVDYLSRVASGDYTARVDVGVLEEDVEGDRELHALGEYLNTTVDALVAALAQAREVQRRYVEQTWQDVVALGRAQPGFAYRENQIAPEVAWLPQMARAVDSAAPVAEGEGAAVPLVINRQVVGALGGEHPDGRPWTAEELSLIEDVTGQLAQTIESLRLFDDVQRRAVQEQVSAQVTARIRESLDMETVLRTATREIRRALNLDDLLIRLVAPQEGRESS